MIKWMPVGSLPGPLRTPGVMRVREWAAVSEPDLVMLCSACRLKVWTERNGENMSMCYFCSASGSQFGPEPQLGKAHKLRLTKLQPTWDRFHELSISRLDSEGKRFARQPRKRERERSSPLVVRFARRGTAEPGSICSWCKPTKSRTDRKTKGGIDCTGAPASGASVQVAAWQECLGIASYIFF